MKSILHTLLLLILFVTPTLGQQSMIDSTFGNNGLVTTQFSSQSGVIDLAEQPNGKILACGDSNLVRYNDDGSIDSSFGINGVVANFGFHATAMELQPDGKILVGGETVPVSSWASTWMSEQRLLRLTASGSVDSTFGINGVAEIGGNQPNSLTDVTVHPTGKIITSGMKTNYYSSLIRAYNPDGTIDSTFSFQPSYNETLVQCNRVFITSDSNILIAGAMHTICPNCACGCSWWDGFRAIKLFINGEIDSTYGVNGMADTVNNWLAYNPVSSLTNEDELVFAANGFNPNNYTLFSTYAKFSATGQIDTTFHATGEYGINTLSSNKSIAVYSGLNDFNINKRDEFGNLDSTCFPETIVDFDTVNQSVLSILETSDGKIVVAGKADGMFALARLDPFQHGTLSDASCESYDFNGTQLSTSGIYRDTVQSINGCDSVITLDLTIYGTQSGAFEDYACEEYTFNGTTYTNTGNYVDTLQSMHGCDSIVELDLTIYPTQSSEIDEEACDVFTWNNETYNNSGIYTDTFQTIHGCDSIVELDLTINTADAQIAQAWDSLIAATIGEAYQWIDCETGLALMGETTKSLAPDSNGSYALVIHQNGCVDTSDCFEIGNVGVNEMNPAQFVVFPNPTAGSFTIQLEHESALSSIAIYSTSGTLVHQSAVQNLQTVHLNLELSKGLYLLQVSTNHTTKTEVLIIQ